MSSIICPYCKQATYDDDYHYVNKEDEPMDCGSCEKEFLVTGHTTITYESKKIPCKNDAHEWDAPQKTVYTQADADRYNREGFLGKRDHKPKLLWQRTCEHCDEQDYAETEPDGACPWPTDKEPVEGIPF